MEIKQYSITNISWPGPYFVLLSVEIESHEDGGELLSEILDFDVAHEYPCSLQHGCDASPVVEDGVTNSVRVVIRPDKQYSSRLVTHSLRDANDVYTNLEKTQTLLLY